MWLIKGIFEALRAATRAVFRKRMTLKYPNVHLETTYAQGGYTYDPKKGVALPGYKGRHILYLDKCTGCQLCAIACEDIARCIEMVKVDVTKPPNKRSIFPQIDYGNCVFCGFCVDACPFYAIFMTSEYELSVTDKRSLIFSPEQLAVPPKKRTENLVDFKVGDRGAHHG